MKFILLSVIMNVNTATPLTTEVDQTQMYFDSKETCVAAMARLIPNPTSTGDLSREMVVDYAPKTASSSVKMAHNVYCFPR